MAGKMSNSIIVRIQSPDHGTKRIQSKSTERVNDFLGKVKEAFGLANGGWNLYVNRDKTGEIVASRSKTLSSYKVRHGDMLYLTPGVVDMDMTDHPRATGGGDPKWAEPRGATSAEPMAQASRPTSAARASVSVIEDEVDQFLEKLDGCIYREKHEQLCRHGAQGKCVHCIPLEPYDEQYLKSADPPIKFLAFHSNLRKLTGGADKGKFAMLENLSCKIKPGCREHPPWPGGICTKCQPNAVTLNRQTYRHVDYTQFENPFLMERFLNFWRNTGNQRIGILYGRYEHYKDVPLGIKAVVSAIFEPPQISSRNSVELLDDDRTIVNKVAAKLGLRAVGWIFTDLVAQDLTKGTVKHFRGNINSHFLSAEECIMAAHFQNEYANPCKLSPEGHFGSKFVTVVVTGDKTNQIHFEGYQVSNQGMALIRDDCFIPTKDAAELGYVKESSNEQYVPDVFFKEKDKYGNEVTQLARPLPVEYLLVDFPAAFPVEPVFTFSAGNSHKPFPLENRHDIGESQDFNAFGAYMQQFSREQFLEALSDFHVLLYLSTCDMLPLKGHLDTLLQAVKDKDEDLAHHWSKTEEWATVEELMAANSPSPVASRQSSYVGANASPLPPIGASASAMWTCKHCTYINKQDTTTCEMCTLPK